MAFFRENLELAVAFVREHEAWAAPIVFVLAFAESLAFVSLVFPFWGALVGIGTLFGAGASMSFVSIWFAAALGAAFGDWLSYWIGYRYHAQIAHFWPLSKHPELLERGHTFFKKWGAWAIVMGRFWGPLRASVPIVAGVIQMPWLSFQMANFGSAFLWAFVLLSPGAFGLGWWLGPTGR